MLRRQFLLFATAGTLAFLVDAGLVQALVRLAEIDPYLARFGSAACAVLFTWVFNRQLTFAEARRAAGQPVRQEFARYLIAQSGGFVVNYAVYALLVHALPQARAWPAAAVAAGALAGLSANFLSARRWVFRAG